MPYVHWRELSTEFEFAANVSRPQKTVKVGARWVVELRNGWSEAEIRIEGMKNRENKYTPTICENSTTGKYTGTG